MNLFKNSKVNLHPFEKLGILMTTFLVDFTMFMVGYTLLFDMRGYNFTGIMLMIVAIVHLSFTYGILQGKGLNKELK